VPCMLYVPNAMKTMTPLAVTVAVLFGAAFDSTEAFGSREKVGVPAALTMPGTIQDRHSFAVRASAAQGWQRTPLPSRLHAGANSKSGDQKNKSEPHKQSRLPRAIIFDLDGCLWTPEMYEILYFMEGKGSPFREDPDNKGVLLTSGNQRVRLLADVRSVFEDLCAQPCFENVCIGISSRTDEPNWARELLEKFKITTVNRDGGDDATTTTVTTPSLADIIGDGPVEMSFDAKTKHFERIRIDTGIEYEDMVFFDNEYGNCEKVASLGVSVVYCPKGVTRELWEKGVREEFPSIDGSVINGDQNGWGW